MRRIRLILPFLFAFIGASAQYDEVGGFVGTVFKIDKELSKPSMAYELIYRHSFDSRQAVSGTFTYAKFYELAARYEINYLNFYLGSKRNFYSTYIFGGLAFAVGKDTVNLFSGPESFVTTKDSTQWVVSLPFGLGYKYSIGESLGLAVEIGLRKNLGLGRDVNFLQPSLRFYGFAGVAVTYKFSFVNRQKCRNLEF
ncbi:MAG: hypothetical protein PHD25_00170 [Bacteroidales bacterium]|nr:hypothetical protein [Bacteroidales bacterium]